MKPYQVQVTITNRYNVEIHAETETSAVEQAENMKAQQIEDGGDFVEMVEITAVDVVLLEPEDEEDEEDEASEEAEPEPDDTVTGVEVEPAQFEMQPDGVVTTISPVTLNPDGSIAEEVDDG